MTGLAVQPGCRQFAGQHEGDMGVNAVIEVTAARKRFGPVLALDGISFAVMPGRVTGFIGPNGAGKSTTMRVILGLDAPDEGRALVGGRPYRSLERPLTHLGSLLDAAALQPGRNHLRWLAHSQGLDARRADRVAGGSRCAPRRPAVPVRGCGPVGACAH
jgi:ABC-2 type transport system ATP-binding protein